MRDAGQDQVVELADHRVERLAVLGRTGRQPGSDVARGDLGQDGEVLDPLQVAGDPLDDLVPEPPELIRVNVNVVGTHEGSRSRIRMRRVAEHGGRRAPDGVAAKLEEPDRPVEAEDAPALLAEDLVEQKLVERNVEDGVDFVGVGIERGPALDDPDIGDDVRPAGHGRQVVELTDDLDLSGVEADLLVSLPERGLHQIGVSGLLAAAGEAHLAGVAAEVPGPAGEDHLDPAVVLVQRDQDRRGPDAEALDGAAAGRRAGSQPRADRVEVEPPQLGRQDRPRSRIAGAAAGRAGDALGTSPRGPFDHRG